MRGKKIDNIFIGNFIIECTTNGLISQNEIINEAKNQINDIDEKIKEVEKLKIKRSKLVDVIIKFNANKRKTNNDEIELLKFFKIKNHNACKFICDSVKNIPVNLSSLNSPDFNNQEILFAINQLVNNNILVKLNDLLNKGPNFDKYMKWVFLE